MTFIVPDLEGASLCPEASGTSDQAQRQLSA
jgi:hypothetical protein